MALRDWPLAPVPLTLLSSHALIFVCTCICGFLVPLARCGTLPEGSPCSTSNNRIDELSHRFIDDCDDKTFCSGSIDGTCIPKRCRTDLFPFGYKDEDVLPPLCDPGFFCPDEGGGCRPLVEVGLPCQMNQDRQCAPAPDWRELASDWNYNGSLCLGSICSCVSSLGFSWLVSLSRSTIFLSGCVQSEAMRASRLVSPARWTPRTTFPLVRTGKSSLPRSPATTVRPPSSFAASRHASANTRDPSVLSAATIKNVNSCVPSPRRKNPLLT